MHDLLLRLILANESVDRNLLNITNLQYISKMAKKRKKAAKKTAPRKKTKATARKTTGRAKATRKPAKKK